MKSYLKLGMTFIAGAAIGAFAIQQLHAQSKPRAYLIADVAEISDAKSFGGAAQKMRPIIEAAGGRTLIQTQNIIANSGTPPQRVAVIEFENLDAAKAWADKPDAKAAMGELDKYSKQRRFIVEGLK
jgi:uncharacterized protein (DUF1330 family)